MQEVLERLSALPEGARLLGALEGLPGLHLVGGAVRDLALGRPPRDLDVVAEHDGPAVAAELARRLGASPPVVHGRFGTAAVEGVNVATVRAETYPRPGALPEVQPGTLEDDMARRDFGVNAIAVGISPDRRGEVNAAPGALDDLGARRLRVLHEGSFRDDPDAARAPGALRGAARVRRGRAHGRAGARGLRVRRAGDRRPRSDGQRAPARAGRARSGRRARRAARAGGRRAARPGAGRRPGAAADGTGAAGRRPPRPAGGAGPRRPARGAARLARGHPPARRRPRSSTPSRTRSGWRRRCARRGGRPSCGACCVAGRRRPSRWRARSGARTRRRAGGSATCATCGSRSAATTCCGRAIAPGPEVGRRLEAALARKLDEGLGGREEELAAALEGRG